MSEHTQQERTIRVTGPRSSSAISAAIRIAQLEEKITMANMSGKPEIRDSGRSAENQLARLLETMDKEITSVSKNFTKGNKRSNKNGSGSKRKQHDSSATKAKNGLSKQSKSTT